jgi:hypothetical protein
LLTQLEERRVLAREKNTGARKAAEVAQQRQEDKLRKLNALRQAEQVGLVVAG